MSVLDRFKLDGKVALVTAGAGPLFGSSITEALAEAGATVITASRSLERNEAYAAELRSKGFDAHGMQVDIGDAASIEGLRAAVKERFGRLDVLVNSALSRPKGMSVVEEVTLESLEVNARADMVGLILMCKAFCPDMAERGRGSVINIASIYGLVGNDPNLYLETDMKPPIVYPFLKGGMINMTRSLAAHYGKRGVRVNSISPGGYSPDAPEPFAGRYSQRCPLGRMMTNEDIQGAVVFLASDASQYVTGANLAVDGGWTAI
ncbi:MAG: SDR family oxidoreductase [Phycisphaerae bacterium]|nr:SDR family oxidoreductase [Phycisphaerae bacterium]